MDHLSTSSAQRLAIERYEKKRGLISKSYKLPRDLVEAFAEACEDAGTTQAAQLTKYMKGFCKRHDIEV